MRTSAARAAFLRLAYLGTLPLLLVAPACGGAAPPPPVASAPKAPPPPAPPPPELGAVPDPAGLVLSGGLSKLGASLATVHGYSQLPMPQSEQITEILTGEAIGPVVDLDQPVYFALSIVGSGMRMKPPLFALSAAVKDPDQVKAQLAERYKLVPGDNGTTLIQGLGRATHKSADTDAEDDDDQPSGGLGGDGNDGRTCELAASYGAAPVRIVCGLSAKAVSELGPWLTRTAPRTALSTDLHADVRMAPLRETINEGKKLAGILLGSILGGGLHAGWARELLLAAAGDAADFGSDVDTVTFDATLADSGATTRLGVKLATQTSLLSRLGTAHPERSGPAPAAFWALPADADIAFFNRGEDEDTIAHARQLLVDGIAGGLVEDGVKAPDASAVAGGFGKLLTSAAGVYAGGLDIAAAQKVLLAERAASAGTDPAAAVDAHHAAAEELLGWRVFGFEQKSATLSSAVKDLAAAMGKASLVAALKAHDKDAPPLTLRSAPIAKAAGLPAAASHWVLEIPVHVRKPKADADPKPNKGNTKKAAPPPKPVQVHLYVVPDGDRTWLGVGGDEALVASKLAGLSTGSGHLDGRPELAFLKTGSVGSGGFFSARGLPWPSLQLRLLSGGPTSGAGETLTELEQMPQKGTTPIPFSTTAAAGGFTTELTVPRGAIEDVVGAILRHGGF